MKVLKSRLLDLEIEKLNKRTINGFILSKFLPFIVLQLVANYNVNLIPPKIVLFGAGS